MIVKIYSKPMIQICNKEGLELADSSNPVFVNLIDPGTVRVSSGGETANITVRSGMVDKVLSRPPLQARITVENAAKVLFDGIVTRISVGSDMTILAEA